MNRITNIFKILIGVLGAVLFIRVFYTGDEALEADAGLQDTVVAPLMYLAYVIFALGVVATLGFSIKAIFGGNIVKTLISLGILVVVFGISYAAANGVETPLRDGEVLSANGSRWVGTGLFAFYILAVLAVGAMLVSSVKKLITR